MKVSLNSFHLNDHTLGVYSTTKNARTTLSSIINSTKFECAEPSKLAFAECSHLDV